MSTPSSGGLTRDVRQGPHRRPVTTQASQPFIPEVFLTLHRVPGENYELRRINNMLADMFSPGTFRIHWIDQWAGVLKYLSEPVLRVLRKNPPAPLSPVPAEEIMVPFSMIDYEHYSHTFTDILTDYAIYAYCAEQSLDCRGTGVVGSAEQSLDRRGTGVVGSAEQSLDRRSTGVVGSAGIRAWQEYNPTETRSTEELQTAARRGKRWHRIAEVLGAGFLYAIACSSKPGRWSVKRIRTIDVELMLTWIPTQPHLVEFGRDLSILMARVLRSEDPLGSTKDVVDMLRKPGLEFFFEQGVVA
ncbi:hypothetical protein BDZ91DRAFT_799208 [Kalaharituber pfeilii]|nr:hypothetical protein BDZ91DRAFT_799208 [Kalaharituber pfeilii]